jgi:CheY-like chemotaxis protein
MNLATNAAEAFTNGGTIVVSTRNHTIEDSASDTQNLEPGEYIELSVWDNGPGIASTDLSHIFEPFYTRKVMGKSGTGLGLTVVWNTMEDHNGKVFVDNSGGGTCFHLYFPVTMEEKTPEGASEEVEDLTGNGEHILVVDDEDILRDVGNRMLQTLGYRTDSVASGEEALRFVSETKVDLVVIDMLMEPGMNGYQTYAEILKLYPHQKAIIASGFSESNDVKAALAKGATKFIKKPYSMEEIGKAVKEALKG